MRVKSPRRQRHNKVLKLAKGYRMARSRRYKVAQQAVLQAGQYAYSGRRLRRRDKRTEWIVQINAALSQLSAETKQPKIAYSRLIKALKDKEITLDRKTLAALSIDNFNSFKQVVDSAMA